MKQLTQLVPNHTTGTLMKAYDITDQHRLFTLVFGDTGRGKTLSAKHWSKDNKALYVRCRVKCTAPKLARLIAEEITGNASGSSERNERTIINYLKGNDTTTIILDEVNHILDMAPAQAKDSLNFIRDLWDIAECGIVLITTDYNLQYLENSALSKFLKQFEGRMGYNIVVPNRILKQSDVLPILREYSPDPSAELFAKAAEIAENSKGKIRTLVKYLELARKYQATHGDKISAVMLDRLRERYEGGGEWPDN